MKTRFNRNYIIYIRLYRFSSLSKRNNSSLNLQHVSASFSQVTPQNPWPSEPSLWPNAANESAAPSGSSRSGARPDFRRHPRSVARSYRCLLSEGLWLGNGMIFARNSVRIWVMFDHISWYWYTVFLCISNISGLTPRYRTPQLWQCRKQTSCPKGGSWNVRRPCTADQVSLGLANQSKLKVYYGKSSSLLHLLLCVNSRSFCEAHTLDYITTRYNNINIITTSQVRLIFIVGPPFAWRCLTSSMVVTILGTTRKMSSCSPKTSTWYLKIARRKSSAVKVNLSSRIENIENHISSIWASWAKVCMTMSLQSHSDSALEKQGKHAAWTSVEIFTVLHPSWFCISLGVPLWFKYCHKPLLLLNAEIHFIFDFGISQVRYLNVSHFPQKFPWIDFENTGRHKSYQPLSKNLTGSG